MIKRINYTGRRKIHREDTQFIIRNDTPDKISFDAILSLESYNLPSDARVSVEAYRQTSWMRFDFGTVGNISNPSDRTLTEFDSSEGILFRLKVNSGGSPAGKLLAAADKISLRRSEEEFDNCIPLLPVRPKKLEGQISRVDFEDEEQPRLEINTEVGDWRQLTLNPAFMSLVLTYAVRDILTRILHIDDYKETTDSDDWRSNWLRFTCQLPGVSDIESVDKDSYDYWIEDAVSSFGRTQGILNQFNSFWNEEVKG